MGMECVLCDVRTSVLCITDMKASIPNSHNTIHFVSFLFIFYFSGGEVAREYVSRN